MTETSRRLFLAAGSAAAARTSDLDSLIEAHRRALAAFHDAVDAEAAAEAALAAAYPDGLRVPDGVGGSFDGLIYDSNEIKERIATAFDRKRRELAFIEAIAPGSTALAVAALLAKEAEAFAGVDAIFDRECGEFVAAEKKRQEASDASVMEDDAVLAICSYPCATMEEARMKAAYVAAIPSIDDFGGGHVLAFIRSFASSEEASS